MAQFFKPCPGRLSSKCILFFKSCLGLEAELGGRQAGHMQKALELVTHATTGKAVVILGWSKHFFKMDV